MHGMEYVVYILSCADGTYYTGITNDLERRLVAHNTGKAGAKYTRGRRPVRLLWSEVCATRGAALMREAVIKGMTRSEKEEMICRGD